MTKRGKWLAVASALPFILMLSVAARAESSDSQYCLALAQKYNQYLDETVGQGGLPPSLEGRLAIERCSGSSTKASISTLERKLTNAKIGLPKRQIAIDAERVR